MKLSPGAQVDALVAGAALTTGSAVATSSTPVLATGGRATASDFDTSVRPVPFLTRGPPIPEPVPNARLLANIVNVARTFKGADEKFVIFLSTHGDPALQANANKLSLDLLRNIIAKARDNPLWPDDKVLREAQGPITSGRFTPPPDLGSPLAPILPPPCSANIPFILVGGVDPLIQAIVWAVRACPMSGDQDYVERAFAALRALQCVGSECTTAYEGFDPTFLSVLIQAVRFGIEDPSQALNYAQNAMADPSRNQAFLRALVELARDPEGLGLPYEYILVLALRRVGLESVTYGLDRGLIANIVSRARVFPNETVGEILAFAKGTTFNLTAVSPISVVPNPLPLVEALIHCVLHQPIFSNAERYSCALTRARTQHPDFVGPAAISPAQLSAIIDEILREQPILGPNGYTIGATPEEILARALERANTRELIGLEPHPATLRLREPLVADSADGPIYTESHFTIRSDSTEIVSSLPGSLCSPKTPCEATYTPGWHHERLHELGGIQSLVLLDQPYSGTFGKVGAPQSEWHKIPGFCVQTSGPNGQPLPGCPPGTGWYGVPPPAPSAIGACLHTRYSMLTSRVGTSANNYTLPAVTAKIEHPIDLAIRFSRGKCPLLIPYELAVFAGGDNLSVESIAYKVETAVNAAILEAARGAGNDFLRSLMFAVSFGAEGNLPTVRVRPMYGYLQPHFFRNTSGRLEGGLAVGGSLSVLISGEADLYVRFEAAYAIKASSFTFVRATALPEHTWVQVSSDPHSPHIDLYVWDRLMWSLAGGCSGDPSRCVPALIEQAVDDAFNSTIADPQTGEPVATFPEVLQRLYPPRGLMPTDISHVNVLPTGFDFVVLPHRCPPDFPSMTNSAIDILNALDREDFPKLPLLKHFETVAFETGLLPAKYEGYAGYCSLGRRSL